MFSCEPCEISKKTFFTEHLWTTASERLGIGFILKKFCFLFIKVTRKNFYYHISFLRDFFCNNSFDTKTIKFNRFQNRKTFLFHVLSNWFEWNVKWKIFLLINYSWQKILFYNISGAIHSNNISEILILFEYFRIMYPHQRRFMIKDKLKAFKDFKYK